VEEPSFDLAKPERRIPAGEDMPPDLEAPPGVAFTFKFYALATFLKLFPANGSISI